MSLGDVVGIADAGVIGSAKIQHLRRRQSTTLKVEIARGVFVGIASAVLGSDFYVNATVAQSITQLFSELCAPVFFPIAAHGVSDL